jgi:hypothetical protein
VRLVLLRVFLGIALCGAALGQGRQVSQEAINDAVDRGVAWLLQQQRRDGSWGENDLSPVPKGGHRDSRNDLTAFCAYTLLKCKVPKDHPALQRALLYLEQDRPRTTYSISNQLMLLAATGDERWEDRIDQLVEDLLELRFPGHETWGYPGHPSIQTDLSNTQYAVLGLRAAAMSGAKIPSKIWPAIAERVLMHQEEPQEAEPEEGRTTRPMKAGFAYLLPNPASKSFGYNVPNASMTAAGLTVLRIVEQQLGSKYPGRLRRRANDAVRLGFRWLEEGFSVTSNTAGEESWIYYYLYGLQRVGALFEIEKIGTHDWYWEGAAELVKWQGADGHWQKGGFQDWPRQPMPHANSCYALLFLVKAMAPVTSETPERSGVYAAEAPSDQVHLRAAVRSDLSIWVSGFGEGVLEQNRATTEDGDGLLVREVRYYVDEQLSATVPGQVESPWKGERFAQKLSLGRNGTFAVRAEVSLRGPSGGEVVLRSATLQVELLGIMEPWMLEYTAAGVGNLLSSAELTLTASSERGKWTTVGRAVDGYEASRWMAAPEDRRPRVRIELGRAARADTLVLAQADSHPGELGRHPRVKRVAIRVNNDKDALEVDLPEDVIRPARITLAKRVRVRVIEVEILEYVPGSEYKDGPGFAEIGLFDLR